MKTLFATLASIIGMVFIAQAVFADGADIVMSCRALGGSGVVPDGWDYSSAGVYGSDTSGYRIELSFSDRRPSRTIPMALVSKDQPGFNRIYSADGCKISFQSPIQQPDEGVITCTDESVWASCINSIE